MSQTAKQQTAKKAPPSPAPDKRTSQPVTRLELSNLLVAGVGALAAIFALYQTTQALNLTRDSLEVAERAWVVPDTVSFSVPSDPSSPIVISHSVKNVGNTPALSLDIATHPYAIDRSAFDSSQFPEQWEAGDEIVAGGKMDAISTPRGSAVLGRDQTLFAGSNTADSRFNVDVTPQLLDDLASGKKIVVLFVKATYTDVFKKPRITYSCRYWSKDSPNRVCRRWNSAT